MAELGMLLALWDLFLVVSVFSIVTMFVIAILPEAIDYFERDRKK
jgi:hypothetical protein